VRTLASALAYTLLAAVVALALTVTITTGIFWATIACVAVASLVILTWHIRQVLAENDAPDLEPVRDVCDLESCGEPSAVEFAGGNGPLYICAKHAGPVSAWAPAVGVRMPYDQTEESA
jgi:hypothetical protein